MSRQHRPMRRVRGADRALFEDVYLFEKCHGCPSLADVARRLHTRPAIVRRCLLGRPVSARAARRLLG